MNDFISTTASAVTSTVSTVAAANTGDAILTYVTIAINAAMLIFNFVLDCRRRWHTQLKDLKSDDKDGGES